MTTEFLTTVVSLSVFMLGTVLSILWFFGGRLDGRFDRIDVRFDRVDARFDRVDDRFDRLEERVDRLAEDVAVLKATQ